MLVKESSQWHYLQWLHPHSGKFGLLFMRSLCPKLIFTVCNQCIIITILSDIDLYVIIFQYQLQENLSVNKCFTWLFLQRLQHHRRKIGNLTLYEVIVFKAHFLAYTSRYAKSSSCTIIRREWRKFWHIAFADSLPALCDPPVLPG